MERLRTWTRRGALTLTLALFSGGLFGCGSTQVHQQMEGAIGAAQPAMLVAPTRPTLYEVRRGAQPANATPIAYYTQWVDPEDEKLTGKVIYKNGTDLGADYGKEDIFVLVGEVEENFDICAVYKAALNPAKHATWKEKIHMQTGAALCDAK